MRFLIVSAVLLALFKIPLAIADDGVGPCNENYYFNCDEDGNCTCLPLQPIDGTFAVDSIDMLPGGQVASEGGNLFAVSPGDQVEVIADFVPVENSVCTVEIASSINAPNGTAIGGRTSRLDFIAPSRIHNFAALNQRWVKVKFSAEFQAGCKSREIHSFSAKAAVIAGGSGIVRTQSGLRLQGGNFAELFD
ncbi:hypothetical protein [Marinobacter sp. F4216]|uniref:hypothetical protein n=1 Tax=Marinobacter sp. F4216 TaxID=2874281 RepID=UPI001CBADC82|nr:hypothetical protein [Marinobacter sp. F4216]MBZ2169987.1 hypothetical protein [Marinobacter sp. F4216]